MKNEMEVYFNGKKLETREDFTELENVLDYSELNRFDNWCDDFKDGFNPTKTIDGVEYEYLMRGKFEFRRKLFNHISVSNQTK